MDVFANVTVSPDRLVRTTHQRCNTPAHAGQCNLVPWEWDGRFAQSRVHAADERIWLARGMPLWLCRSWSMLACQTKPEIMFWVQRFCFTVPVSASRGSPVTAEVQQWTVPSPLSSQAHIIVIIIVNRNIYAVIDRGVGVVGSILT